MNILFEGLDRCGKDSMIKLIQPLLNDKPLHILHYSNFKGFDTKDQILQYSKKVYSQMFDFINDNSFNVICNRAHLGEYVWGTFRNYTLDERKYVFDLEKNISNQDDVAMFVLIDSSLKCFDRDDGMSLHKSKDELISVINRFKEAYELSNIKNKFLIDISGKSIEDVYNIIMSKLENVRK